MTTVKQSEMIKTIIITLEIFNEIVICINEFIRLENKHSEHIMM